MLKEIQYLISIRFQYLYAVNLCISNHRKFFFFNPSLKMNRMHLGNIHPSLNRCNVYL